MMAVRPPHLVVSEVSKTFGGRVVVDSLSLAVQSGEIISLLGPSGCGKTTLLRMIAGLVDPDGGTIALGGRTLDREPPHRRNVGVVFQNYALFPHLSVAGNVAFSLRSRGMPKAERHKVVADRLALVRMSEFADRPVRSLSGGQQQRVAVARVLAMEPDLLLFDEPFSALDRQLRETMQIELKGLLRQVGISAIFVTHDQDEALQLSDRIAVMNGGAIEQFDTPRTIYERPRSLFTLTFLGQSSRLTGEASASAVDGVTEVATGCGPLRGSGRFLRGSKLAVGVRPEHITLSRDAPAADGRNTLAVRVVETIYRGPRCLVRLAGDGPGELLADLPAAAAAAFEPGMAVTAAWPVGDTLLFPLP